jgi:hypothetical protein
LLCSAAQYFYVFSKSVFSKSVFSKSVLLLCGEVFEVTEKGLFLIFFSLFSLIQDSVIYRLEHGVVIPNLPIGNCLGELTDEIRADYPQGITIEKFCSIGPKTYSYVLNNGIEEVKAKGIPKNSGITYDLYRRMVTTEAEKIVYTVPPTLMFERNKFTPCLWRVEKEKKLQMTYDKRIVIANYRTRPYGTKQN